LNFTVIELTENLDSYPRAGSTKLRMDLKALAYLAFIAAALTGYLNGCLVAIKTRRDR
jgi:hypothetical protein